jgi:hypothetical protein
MSSHAQWPNLDRHATHVAAVRYGRKNRGGHRPRRAEQVDLAFRVSRRLALSNAEIAANLFVCEAAVTSHGGAGAGAGVGRAVHGELRRAVTATEAMTGWPADGLLELGDRGPGSFRR